MSLPPGFKATQATQDWLKAHSGHTVRTETRDLQVGRIGVRQLWKVCGTCNMAHLCGLVSSWLVLEEESDDDDNDSREMPGVRGP
jgi:hypothetical protein